MEPKCQLSTINGMRWNLFIRIWKLSRVCKQCKRVQSSATESWHWPQSSLASSGVQYALCPEYFSIVISFILSWQHLCWLGWMCHYLEELKSTSTLALGDSGDSNMSNSSEWSISNKIPVILPSMCGCMCWNRESAFNKQLFLLLKKV